MAAAARRGGEGEEQLEGGEDLAREGGGKQLEGGEGGWVGEQLEREGETQKQVQKRQLGKLFIRGDNIVLITPVSPEQPP